mmetsp:Transcript_85439/g.169499  ORF Transcript_85439/g.169499 Transcript_85439/m.169499 type:complete len:364 (+) Transcript_85439:778-1869(+)
MWDIRNLPNLNERAAMPCAKRSRRGTSSVSAWSSNIWTAFAKLSGRATGQSKTSLNDGSSLVALFMNSMPKMSFGTCCQVLRSSSTAFAGKRGDTTGSLVAPRPSTEVMASTRHPRHRGEYSRPIASVCAARLICFQVFAQASTTVASSLPFSNLANSCARNVRQIASSRTCWSGSPTLTSFATRQAARCAMCASTPEPRSSASSLYFRLAAAVLVPLSSLCFAETSSRKTQCSSCGARAASRSAAGASSVPPLSFKTHWSTCMPYSSAVMQASSCLGCFLSAVSRSWIALSNGFFRLCNACQIKKPPMPPEAAANATTVARGRVSVEAAAAAAAVAPNTDEAAAEAIASKRAAIELQMSLQT